jgi:putative ABC transport system permease protein
MPRFAGVRRLFRVADRSADALADVDDELRFHIESRIAELVARGRSLDEARRSAIADFGDLRGYRDQTLHIDRQYAREARMREWIQSVVADLRYAVRAFARSRAFTAAALVCIALGVSVTTTIFSAVDAILIRPLPYHDADRLIAVYAQDPVRNYFGSNISYPDYVDWRARNRTLSSLAIWTWSSHSLANGEAERVEGAEVAANLFATLGVRPLIGRGFLPEEETPGRDRVVILSHGLWQRRFAGDSTIVGRTITMDAAPYTVVGVMPPNFNFPDRGQLWVPFASGAAREVRANRMYAGAIGRLKPGVTFAQAEADLAAVSRALEQQFPDDNRNWAAEPMSLRQALTGDLRRPVLIFLAAVTLVLLIACANVANLMLARGITRSRELALRSALGAGRRRLLRQLLTESALLALTGGALGALASFAGIRLLRFAFPQDVPFYIQLRIDGVALAFALTASLATGLLFGLLPAVRAARVDVNASLREGARTGSDAGRSRLRSSLVALEIALSVVLMVGASLLIRSYRAYASTELGFAERGVLTARISLPYEQSRARPPRLEFYDRLHARLRAMPGVVAAGSAQGIPFSGWQVQSSAFAEGDPPPQPGTEVDAHFQRITPEFFEAMGVSMVAGRALTAADRDSAAPTVLVNEQLVARLFAGRDPIGRRVKVGSLDSSQPWATIVGVVKDYRNYPLPQPVPPAIYYSYASLPVLNQTVVIRTTAPDPHSLVPALRAAVHDLDPAVPIYDVKTMDEAVSRSLWRQRLNGQVLGIFAALALLLATVGIYGVISYAVTQRTREIGVRMALGAGRADVLALVVGQGARVALAGIVIGGLGALALSRVLASLLYEVGPTDPVTFVAVPVLIAGVALLASYLPARRAAKLDAALAIRAE